MRKASAAALCLLVSLAGVSVAQTERAWEFDEFSGFTCIDMKARLDNFLYAVPSAQGAQAFIIVYAGKRSLRNEARAWMEEAESYLTGRRGLKRERLAMLNGGYRETRAMELWFLPEGATAPAATPSVRPEDVRFKKGSARNYVLRSCMD